jgi:imidazolonepropionase-like amidohydrolase
MTIEERLKPVLISFHLFLLLSAYIPFAAAAELRPPGFRPLPLGAHALVGGTVVSKPGESLENATILIRDGVIQAVGKDLTAPADARLWDMKGKTIYAGFIDPYVVADGTNGPISTETSEPLSTTEFTSRGLSFFGAPGAEPDKGRPGPGYEVAKITPEFRAIREYSPKPKMLESLRELGFTAGTIAPVKGIIRGTSALVAFSEEDPNEVVIKSDVFQHIAFETHQTGERSYPGSLMGVIAAIRQAFLDAQHYAADHAAYKDNPQGRQPPEFDPAMEALGQTTTRKMTVAFEPGSALMVDRASRLAAELGIEFCIMSCGQEWRRPDLAKATRATFVVPLDFPTLPKLTNPDDWDQIQLDQLRKWDWAPENPALLRKEGLEIALTAYGLSDKKRFRDNLRLALDRGLTETDALAALTTVPARLCGVGNILGSIEKGKLANLTVVDGDSYFNPETKVTAVWINGRVFEAPAEEPKTEKPETAKAAAAAEQKVPPKGKEEPEKSAKPPEVAAQEQKKPAEPVTKDEEKPEKKEKTKERVREVQKNRVARSPLVGRGPLAMPEAVLIEGATLWTCGPQGRLEKSDLLLVGGKIKAVGKDLKSQLQGVPNPLLIDGQTFHVTPGLIDCHSHTAILGSVNESTLPSTAMVRIHDVVNSETDDLYEQLAGGVTTVNLLHGSANPIGGQNCVIKLRDGAGPEELVFTAAPPGIKFALGENVKQSNWGEKFNTRFPQTRMGVSTFIANRFTAAQEYLDDLKTNAAPHGVTPRRNLELEAIGEIIQGKRWIHCHSYRQDEILMLIRQMESFGVKIDTFQHVLEGYKVADEIARHGAGGSTFSDWWAYKFEVYDAIPYNGSLMRDRGVVVSFNSDSSELARRLYTEAAKAVKYGGTPEEEALKFVTINPANQLHIDQYVGSLEPGKDADIAIWSKSPLDSTTVCLQTWIDGKKYFDRALNAERAAKLQQERNDLITKARQLEKISGSGEDSATVKEDKQSKAFWQISLEHQFDGHARGCLDE